jgi:hypothetical protein
VVAVTVVGSGGREDGVWVDSSSRGGLGQKRRFACTHCTARSESGWMIRFSCSRPHDNSYIHTPVDVKSIDSKHPVKFLFAEREFIERLHNLKINYNYRPKDNSLKTEGVSLHQ